MLVFPKCYINRMQMCLAFDSCSFYNSPPARVCKQMNLAPNPQFEAPTLFTFCLLNDHQQPTCWETSFDVDFKFDKMGAGEQSRMYCRCSYLNSRQVNRDFLVTCRTWI